MTLARLQERTKISSKNYMYSILRDLIEAERVIKVGNEYRLTHSVSNKPTKLPQGYGPLADNFIRRGPTDEMVQQIKENLDVNLALEGHIMWCIYNDIPLPKPTREEKIESTEVASRFMNWMIDNS